MLTTFVGCSKSKDVIKQETFDKCLSQANQTFTSGNLDTKTGFMEQCMMTADYFYKNDSSCPSILALNGKYEMYFLYKCYE